MSGRTLKRGETFGMGDRQNVSSMISSRIAKTYLFHHENTKLPWGGSNASRRYCSMPNELSTRSAEQNSSQKTGTAATPT